MGGCCCCFSKGVELNTSPRFYHYPIASEERQPLSSSKSGAVSAPLFVDTLQRVGAKVELMLYEGKTHIDVFVQLQDWNNRRQFAHPSYFHADGVNDHFISQGIYQLCLSIGIQVHKPNLQNPNQSYLASQQHQQHQHQQQQEVLAHAQAQGKLGASPNYKFSRLSRGNIIMKDGQPLRNEGSNGIFKNAKNIERLKKYFDICGGLATFIQVPLLILSICSINQSQAINLLVFQSTNLSDAMNYTDKQLTAAVVSKGLRPGLAGTESGAPPRLLSLHGFALLPVTGL
ncbi:hypothetical protein Lser_V15G18169 [Lactuca serriola]